MVSKKQDLEDIPQVRSEPRPEALAKPVRREQLPEDLQKLVDKEDDFLDRLYEGR